MGNIERNQIRRIIFIEKCRRFILKSIKDNNLSSYISIEKNALVIHEENAKVNLLINLIKQNYVINSVLIAQNNL